MLSSISRFCVLSTQQDNRVDINVSHAKINIINQLQEHDNSNHSNNHNTTNNVQKLAVRELLSNLLISIGYDDNLCEESYPYYLQKRGDIVSFTHSADYCAVVISASHTVGIDIEQQNVPWTVCQRFFAINEIKLLHELDSENNTYDTAHKQKLCNILWQAKECLIKIEQISLAKGLAVDFSDFIEQYNQEYNRQYNQKYNREYNQHNTQEYSQQHNDVWDESCFDITLLRAKREQKYSLYINQRLKLVVLF